MLAHLPKNWLTPTKELVECGHSACSLAGSSRKMPRPKAKTPTHAELEILHVLWDRGPSTVRDVLEVLNRRRKRAYTSIMNLMNIMADKGLVLRETEEKAFVYRAKKARDNTVGRIVQDVLGRVFS